jgi:hypothetical protein
MRLRRLSLPSRDGRRSRTGARCGCLRGGEHAAAAGARRDESTRIRRIAVATARKRARPCHSARHWSTRRREGSCTSAPELSVCLSLTRRSALWATVARSDFELRVPKWKAEDVSGVAMQSSSGTLRLTHVRAVPSTKARPRRGDVCPDVTSHLSESLQNTMLVVANQHMDERQAARTFALLHMALRGSQEAVRTTPHHASPAGNTSRGRARHRALPLDVSNHGFVRKAIRPWRALAALPESSPAA